MRLINVSTLQLEWFIDHEHAPPYAILSHTWADGEVTSQDFMSKDRPAALGLPGFRKIELACKQARIDGLTHAWVDTCCIDKTSSAELTEAINSMYKWYGKSAVCYAFLSDLPTGDPIVEGDGEGSGGSRHSAAFANSRWFTRGWTLQELIAPQTVLFYDSAWKLRGTKESLAPVLSAITRIEEPVLRGAVDIATLPLARRMAWAAGRNTTRVEDLAYCLLGIFDVNMSMLYGEGKKAFIRLQEEIMRDSNDTSLFAWQAKPGGQAYRGILAESPSEFADAWRIEHGRDARFDAEFSSTNKGIRMHANLRTADGGPIFPLTCRLGGNPVAIHLHQHGAGLYARARAESLLTQSDDDSKKWKTQGISTAGSMAQTTALYISKTVPPALSASMPVAHKNGIRLRKGFSFSNDLGATANSDTPPTGITRVTWAHPSDQWDRTRELFLTGGGEDFTAVVMSYGGGLDTAMIIVGIKGRKPWASFLDMVADKHLIPDPSKALWDLENLGRVGPELRKMYYKGLQLEVSREVLDGVAVFCVDLSECPKDSLEWMPRSDRCPSL